MSTLIIFATFLTTVLPAAVEEVKYKGYTLYEGVQDQYPDNFYLLPSYPNQPKQIARLDYYHENGYITWLKATWERRDQ